MGCGGWAPRGLAAACGRSALLLFALLRCSSGAGNVRSADIFDADAADAIFSRISDADAQPATNASCFMPANSLIVSYTNAYHFNLTLLQREGLQLRGMLECLAPRIAVLGMDSESVELCTGAGWANCGQVTSGNVKASDYGKADYGAILYIKARAVACHSAVF
jgi:hypothetical protein